MGRLPSNDIPVNRAQESQGTPASPPRRRGRLDAEEDLPAQIRAIVSQPLSIPEPPRQTLPKLVALVVVLMVALAIFAMIWHQRAQGPGSNAPSVPAVNGQRGDAPSTNPPLVHTLPSRKLKTASDPGTGMAVKYGISEPPKEGISGSGNKQHGRGRTTGAPVFLSTQVPSGTHAKTYANKEPIVSIGPESVLSTRKEVDGRQDVKMETATARGTADHTITTPVAIPQRTLTPEQKRMAGIPYDTTYTDNTDQTTIMALRTPTPAEKQRIADSSGVTPGPNSPVDKKTGARSATPPIIRPRADSRVPLLPSPPAPKKSNL